MESNDRAGVLLAQPRSFGERARAAEQFCTSRNVALPVLVDGIDNAVGETYSGFPDRLYVIDRRGRVAYKGGRGPMGFDPESLEQALVLTLLEERFRTF